MSFAALADVDRVKAAQADVFDVPSWSRQLDGAVGVISCLGGFGTNEAMFKVRRGECF